MIWVISLRTLRSPGKPEPRLGGLVVPHPLPAPLLAPSPGRRSGALLWRPAKPCLAGRLAFHGDFEDTMALMGALRTPGHP